MGPHIPKHGKGTITEIGDGRWGAQSPQILEDVEAIEPSCARREEDARSSIKKASEKPISLASPLTYYYYSFRILTNPVGSVRNTPTLVVLPPDGTPVATAL